MTEHGLTMSVLLYDCNTNGHSAQTDLNADEQDAGHEVGLDTFRTLMLSQRLGVLYDGHVVLLQGKVVGIDFCSMVSVVGLMYGA